MKDRSEFLDLNDLLFTPTNYKEKGEGLLKWFLSSLEYFPESIREVSKTTEINYNSLRKFISGKSKYMSYKNMLALRDYVHSLMKPGVVNLEELEKESFFHG